MRALSLTQPWASLVAVGEKRYETRSWSTNVRGLVAIHAAKGFPVWCRGLCEMPTFQNTLVRHGIYPWMTLPTGAILAVADLTYCEPTETAAKRLREAGEDSEIMFGDYTPTRFAFRLGNVRRLPTPVACKGALGFWNMPDDVAAKVLEEAGMPI